MAEKCNPVTTTVASVTTITPRTTSTDDDVVIALATLNTTCLVDDKTSDADSVGNANTSGVKKPKARRGKIKMEKESNLLVTFLKRKSGLVKKANELCTVCGVQCALVVFSPASKVFSFGHPSVDEVADRYLSGNPNPVFGPQDEAGNQIIPQGLIQAFVPVHAANAEDLIAELRDLEGAFEAAKKHGKEMDKRRVANMASCWWERALQELNVRQVETLKRAMVNLKSKVFDTAKLRFLCSAAGKNNHGPDEAGPSGHASGSWVGSSVGSPGGSSGGGTGPSSDIP